MVTNELMVKGVVSIHDTSSRRQGRTVRVTHGVDANSVPVSLIHERVGRGGKKVVTPVYPAGNRFISTKELPLHRRFLAAFTNFS